MLSMIVVTLLAALYGLAWHNQPAREAVIVRRNPRRQERHE